MPYPEVTRQPSPSSIAVASEQVGHEQPAPVIVFGALRSGTTLLRLMLNAHPDLNNPGEVDFSDGPHPARIRPRRRAGAMIWPPCGRIACFVPNRSRFPTGWMG